MVEQKAIWMEEGWKGCRVGLLVLMMSRGIWVNWADRSYGCGREQIKAWGSWPGVTNMVWKQWGVGLNQWKRTDRPGAEGSWWSGDVGACKAWCLRWQQPGWGGPPLTDCWRRELSVPSETTSLSGFPSVVFLALPLPSLFLLCLHFFLFIVPTTILSCSCTSYTHFHTCIR